MSKNGIKFLNMELLPKKPGLIIPGELNLQQLQELEKLLNGRPLTYLIQEEGEVDKSLLNYLERDESMGVLFSLDDPEPKEVGKKLKEKISGGGYLLFIPPKVNSLKGLTCKVSRATLRFLCGMGLPVYPLSVHQANENKLSVFSQTREQESILAFGNPIEGEKVTVSQFQESLYEAAEQAYSCRSFLRGSLQQALLGGMKRHGEKTAFYDGANDSETSFFRLFAVSMALSRYIRRVTNKARVGVILPPGKGGMIANLAILFAGKAPVNLNYTASRKSVQSSIQQSGLDKFITADPFVRKITDFPWPPNRDLIFIERVVPKFKKKVVLWSFFAKFLPVNILLNVLGANKSQGDDEAVLLFTSGSSGEPKGVPLSHENLLANVCQFGTRMDLPKDAKLLACLPLFHSFGCTVTLWFPLIEGVGIVSYPSPLETKRLAELIEEQKIYLLLSTPTFLRGFLRRVKKEQLASLKLIVTGAEKLPEHLAGVFEQKFGIRPLEGYGLTETSPVTNCNLPEVSSKGGEEVLPSGRFGSVGHLMSGIAIRLIDPISRERVDLDKGGIICLKGPNIFSGYFNKPKLNEGVLDKEGWFNTGDVGRLDEDGFLYIEGRISRFSKIAGEMVPHETVEEAIVKVMGISDNAERKIAVVGMPDEQKGEAIHLLSTMIGDTPVQETIDLRYKLLDAGIPSLWCPKTMHRVESIPILASGKLDLKACQELAQKVITKN